MSIGCGCTGIRIKDGRDHSILTVYGSRKINACPKFLTPLINQRTYQSTMICLTHAGLRRASSRDQALAVRAQGSDGEAENGDYAVHGLVFPSERRGPCDAPREQPRGRRRRAGVARVAGVAGGAAAQGVGRLRSRVGRTPSVARSARRASRAVDAPSVVLSQKQEVAVCSPAPFFCISTAVTARSKSRRKLREREAPERAWARAVSVRGMQGYQRI